MLSNRQGRSRASTISAHVSRRSPPTYYKEPLTNLNITHISDPYTIGGAPLDSVNFPTTDDDFFSPPPDTNDPGSTTSSPIIENSGRSSPTKRKQTRTRSLTNEFGAFVPSPKFLFTPADSPPAYTPRPTTNFIAKKSISTPVLRSECAPLSDTSNPGGSPGEMDSDSDDDREDDETIYTTWPGSRGMGKPANGLRSRFFGSDSFYPPSRGRDRVKTICTTPGQLCAGETETEIDEPPRHLPTSRIIPSSGPLVPPHTLQQRLTPLLFEFSRLLSIVPAVFGTLYNLYHIFQPPAPRTDGRHSPERIDFAISAIWAILTGFQCLYMTTGLLTRWRLYYPPLSTLVRLLALQGICWPATQLTCTILEHQKRPVIVWAVIGTTTCISRGVQIWVTSNLWWETREVGDGGQAGLRSSLQEDRRGYWKRWGGGKWGGRRWDWKEVGVKCVLPAGIVYCVMAWAEQLRREFSGY